MDYAGLLARILGVFERLGFRDPYEAWLCVEHRCRCPGGVDLGLARRAVWLYVEAVEVFEGRDVVEEWEDRYMEEAGRRLRGECEERVVVLPSWVLLVPGLVVLAVLLALLAL
ncbi:hypothetical protein [Pyrodictium delaneyi]|uniref:hypothetical protein n=1 Tax=Pyrodictium delaneyi TaxID=1273541 RepID=UPI0012E2821E|nr:hypothetical protein [Pyrodictium delaneyi]